MTLKEQIEACRKSWMDCYDRAQSMDKEYWRLKSALNTLKKSMEESNDPGYKSIYQKLISELLSKIPKKEQELKGAMALQKSVLKDWGDLIKEYCQ